MYKTILTPLESTAAYIISIHPLKVAYKIHNNITGLSEAPYGKTTILSTEKQQ